MTEEEFITWIESITPEEMLTEINADGIAPVKSEIDIVNTLRNQMKLSDGVINVLLQFVLLKADQRLAKNYVLKIGGHWARMKIRTVQEAIDLTRKEHR